MLRLLTDPKQSLTRFYGDMVVDELKKKKKLLQVFCESSPCVGLKLLGTGRRLTRFCEVFLDRINIF